MISFTLIKINGPVNARESAASLCPCVICGALNTSLITGFTAAKLTGGGAVKATCPGHDEGFTAARKLEVFTKNKPNTGPFSGGTEQRVQTPKYMHHSGPEVKWTRRRSGWRTEVKQEGLQEEPCG